MIPVYGNDEPVDRVISEIKSSLSPHIPHLEIIIVWTPSGRYQHHSAPFPERDRIKVIMELRRGYGRAYRTGFSYATGDIIVTLDGDGTYPARKIAYLINYLASNNLDFVSTNRLKNYELGAFSPIKLFGNILLSLLLRLMFGASFKDSQSGMWVFKREILGMLRLRETGMAFSSEIKIEAHMAGCKCGEVPILYRRRRKGRTSLNWIRDGFYILKFLIQKKIQCTFERKN